MSSLTPSAVPGWDGSTSPGCFPKIEERLWGNVLDQFSVPLDWLIYDTSNFFSYLAEQTPSQLNEKGHYKAFRHHLRQVGLAVSVVRGLGLPLIHELYGGSQNDATLFPTAITRTIERVRELCDGRVEDLTVVFHKGNNSAQNIQGLDHQGVHFIQLKLREQGISLSLEIIKDELSSLELGLGLPAPVSCSRSSPTNRSFKQKCFPSSHCKM